jgi:hypothetical protein
MSSDKPKLRIDRAAALRELEGGDQKLAKALDNPELDAALEQARKGLKPGEDVFFYELRKGGGQTPAQGTAVPVTAAESGERHVAGSAWAKDGPILPDPRALPSAHAPSPTPPVSMPIPAEPAEEPAAGVPRGMPARKIVALVALALATPCAVYLLLRGTGWGHESPRAAATQEASAQHAPSAPSGEAAVAPSSPPPAPPVGLSASADALATPVIAPSSVPVAPRVRPERWRNRAAVADAGAAEPPLPPDLVQ